MNTIRVRAVAGALVPHPDRPPGPGFRGEYIGWRPAAEGEKPEHVFGSTGGRGLVRNGIATVPETLEVRRALRRGELELVTDEPKSDGADAPEAEV